MACPHYLRQQLFHRIEIDTGLLCQLSQPVIRAGCDRQTFKRLNILGRDRRLQRRDELCRCISHQMLPNKKARQAGLS